MDWTNCPLVEVVPGKLSGAPVIKRSRVRPEDLPEDLTVNEDQGEEWLADAFRLSRETAREALAFYHRHQAALAPAV